jgi:hypothetical protein
LRLPDVQTHHSYHAQYIGNWHSASSQNRRRKRQYNHFKKKGFDDYLNEKKLPNHVHLIPFSVLEPEKNDALLADFFHKNNAIGGIVVLNSRGNVIANYLAKKQINNIKLVCIGLTAQNRKRLKTTHRFFDRPESRTTRIYGDENINRIFNLSKSHSGRKPHAFGYPHQRNHRLLSRIQYLRAKNHL